MRLRLEDMQTVKISFFLFEKERRKEKRRIAVGKMMKIESGVLVVMVSERDRLFQTELFYSAVSFLKVSSTILHLQVTMLHLNVAAIK
jgi:hypothetical protein